MEGSFKLRKILTSRSQIPGSSSLDFYGQVDEVFDQGIRVESIPKTFEYNPAVERINQIINAEAVHMYLEQRQMQNEEAMSITGKYESMRYQNFDRKIL